MNRKEIETKLRLEGYPFVYHWKDAPNTHYPEHTHKDKVVLYTLSGSISMIFKNHTTVLTEGSRFEVPPQTLHQATVGLGGWECVYGEMIEGDA